MHLEEHEKRDLKCTPFDAVRTCSRKTVQSATPQPVPLGHVGLTDAEESRLKLRWDPLEYNFLLRCSTKSSRIDEVQTPFNASLLKLRWKLLQGVIPDVAPTSTAMLCEEGERLCPVVSLQTVWRSPVLVVIHQVRAVRAYKVNEKILQRDKPTREKHFGKKNSGGAFNMVISIFFFSDNSLFYVPIYLSICFYASSCVPSGLCLMTVQRTDDKLVKAAAAIFILLCIFILITPSVHLLFIILILVLRKRPMLFIVLVIVLF